MIINIINILICYYKNKISISAFELKQQISKYKFNYGSYYSYNNISCTDYFIMVYQSGTEIMVKYLVEHGVDINKEDNTGYIRMC